MGDERTASEVLLAIEHKVDTMLKQVKITDLNVKTILNQLNLSSKAQPKPSAGPPRVKPPQPSIPVQGPTAVPVADTPIEVMFTKADPEPVGRQIPSNVTQRIIYGDGRPVILAQVTITDINVKTNVIDKPKTDAHGKWESELLAGKYAVTVIKGPTAAKPPFKMEYEIEIPNNGRPVELERKQVE